MNIKAKVFKRETAIPSIKGVANITIDDCFVVKGILIMEGKNGLFMSMPSKKDKNGDYKDICFPITKEARQQISDEIMKQYNNISNDIQYEKRKKELEYEKKEIEYKIDDLKYIKEKELGYKAEMMSIFRNITTQKQTEEDTKE